MRKLFKFSLNILSLNLLVFKKIKSSPHSQFSINLKYLIKDTIFENMITKEGFQVECTKTEISEDITSFHLSQSFIENQINPKKYFYYPFLLIPLYKIKYKNNKNIHYSFFERNIYNKILKKNENHYYFPKTFKYPFFSSLFYKTEDGKKFNLSNGLDGQRNGYLIFKDQDFNDAIVYFAIFINKINHSHQEENFENLYNSLLIEGKSIKNERSSTNFLLELNLNISSLKEGLIISFHFDSKNEISIFFLLQLKDFDFETLRVILKPKIVDNQLFFDVIKYNNNLVCDNFLEFFCINKKSKKYLKKFLKKQEKLENREKEKCSIF